MRKDLFWLSVSEGSVLGCVDSRPMVWQNIMVAGACAEEATSWRTGVQAKGTTVIFINFWIQIEILANDITSKLYF
jgi:hypothetical protein